jgi:hypothetical protein
MKVIEDKSERLWIPAGQQIQIEQNKIRQAVRAESTPLMSRDIIQFFKKTYGYDLYNNVSDIFENGHPTSLLSEYFRGTIYGTYYSRPEVERNIPPLPQIESKDKTPQSELTFLNPDLPFFAYSGIFFGNTDYRFVSNFLRSTVEKDYPDLTKLGWQIRFPVVGWSKVFAAENFVLSVTKPNRTKPVRTLVEFDCTDQAGIAKLNDIAKKYQDSH